jgi:uncharacterized membrane protein
MSDRHDWAPEGLLVVGFRSHEQSDRFLATLRQLAQAESLVLSQQAQVQRDAAGNPSARKWQPHAHEDPRDAISSGTADTPNPLANVLGMVGNAALADAVPVGMNDDLLRRIASWLPVDGYAVAVVAYIRDGNAVRGAVRSFNDGHLLYQTLPAEMAALIGPLFQG